MSSSKKKGAKEAKSLQDIPRLVNRVDEKIDLEARRKPSLKKLAPVSSVVDDIKKEKSAMDEYKLEVREHLEALPAWMADAVKAIRELRSLPQEDREAYGSKRVERKLNELEDGISAELASESDLVRQKAGESYVRACLLLLREEKAKKVAILAFLEDLKQRGLTKEAELPPPPARTAREENERFFQSQSATKRKEFLIDAFGRGYVLLGSVRNSGVYEEVTGLVASSKLDARGQYEAQAKELEEQGEISLLELLSGTPGRCAFQVPFRELVQQDRVLKLPGGFLLIASDGEEVRIVQGAGALRHDAEAILEWNVLSVESLSEEGFNPPHRLERDEFVAKRKFHSMIRRGLEEARRQDERRRRIEAFKASADAERKTLQSDKGVDCDAESFLLQGASGTFFLDNGHGYVPVPGKDGSDVVKFWEVFCLIERRVRREKSKKTDVQVRVVKYPDRLKDLFLKCSGPFVEGENFEGVGRPLRDMLRRAWTSTKAERDHRELRSEETSPSDSSNDEVSAPPTEIEAKTND